MKAVFGLPSPFFLGYAFLEAWSVCLMFSGSAAGGDVATGLSASIMRDSSSLAIVMGTLALTVACRRRDRVPRLPLSVACALASSFGTTLVLFGSPAVSLVGHVTAGLANAWLWISWGDVFAALETERAERVAIESAVLQTFVIVALLALPSLLRSVLLVLLIPLSCSFYLLSLRRLGTAPESLPNAKSRPATGGEDPALGAAFRWRLALGIGIPIAIAYFLFASDMALPVPDGDLDAVLILGLLLFMVALYLFARLASRFSVGSISQVACGFLVVAVLLGSLGLFFVGAQATVFALTLLYQYLLLMYGAKICARGFGNTVFSFGFLQLVNHAAGLVGAFAYEVTREALNPVPFAAEGTVIMAAAFFLAVWVAGDASGNRGPNAGSAPTTNGSEAHPGPHLDGYGLSARETEVLALLAKGRSAPFIRDELGISLNTVNSHVKHIYTKLGVHTRQELIDKVQDR